MPDLLDLGLAQGALVLDLSNPLLDASEAKFVRAIIQLRLIGGKHFRETDATSLLLSDFGLQRGRTLVWFESSSDFDLSDSVLDHTSDLMI